jgi:NTE family protein
MDSVVKTPIKVTYKSLALEGGGAKGYVYVGVAQELERLGLLEEIEEIAGSSVGAITDLYLASGYTFSQIKEKIFNLDFKKLLLDDHYIMVPLNWMTKFGFFDADLMHQQFRNIVKEVTGNEHATFEQWHDYKIKHPEKKLKDIIVEACNIGTGYNETFSYKTEHKDVPIADAVRASMAFPQVFTPILIKGCLYNDGGMQNNCPISTLANSSGQVGEEAIGVCLEDLANIHFYMHGEKPMPKRIKNTIDCFQGQIEAMLNVQSYYLMTGPYKNKIIYCDTLDAGTLDFGLSKEKKEALAASGQYGVMRYVSLNHPELAAQHYPKETLAILELAQHPLSVTEFLDYFRKNISEACFMPKATDPIHIHWAAMSTLNKKGGCGNRRQNSVGKLVTPSFDHHKLIHSTSSRVDLPDDRAQLEKDKKKSGWCTIV